jgi:hypothetical protein
VRTADEGKVKLARTLSLALLAGGLVLSQGCVTPVTEEELEDTLEQTAERVPDLGRKRIISIYAETPMLAKALLYEARHDPDSQLSALVGKRMAAASKRNISVVVGGPYPELTEQVLRNALDLNHESGLRGMKVVLVSSQGPSPDLSRLARETRVRLYHHSPR